MVMRPQPEGVRRVRRAAGATGKAVQYTIYLGPPAEGVEKEVPIGYTEREAHGSASSWKAFPADGTWPTVHRVHTDAVQALMDKYRETGAVLTESDPAALPPHTPKNKRRQKLRPEDLPEGRKPQVRRPDYESSRETRQRARKSKAARAAEVAEQQAAQQAAQEAETAGEAAAVPDLTAAEAATSATVSAPAVPPATASSAGWAEGYPEPREPERPPVPPAAFLEPSDDPFSDPLNADPLAPGFITR
jgi:hypothetical protein